MLINNNKWIPYLHKHNVIFLLIVLKTTVDRDSNRSRMYGVPGEGGGGVKEGSGCHYSRTNDNISLPRYLSCIATSLENEPHAWILTIIAYS